MISIDRYGHFYCCCCVHRSPDLVLVWFVAVVVVDPSCCPFFALTDLPRHNGTSNFIISCLPPVLLLDTLGPLGCSLSILLGINPIFIKNYQGCGPFDAQLLRSLLVCLFSGLLRNTTVCDFACYGKHIIIHTVHL
jgi:hypothetical protein